MKYNKGDIVTIKERYKDYAFFSKEEYTIINITKEHLFLNKPILRDDNKMGIESFSVIFECKAKIRLEKLKAINNNIK